PWPPCHPGRRARPDHVRDPLSGGCQKGRRHAGVRRRGRPAHRRDGAQAQERLMHPAPWTVIDSEIIVADRWIRLRADTCTDAAGRTIAPYYVLEPSEWISV